MQIWIDNKSGLPIYDQIYSQIKAQIINGTLAADEPLPSIRGLAKDLRISVITTKRAYDELEREGFIYTVAAKGCFVAPKNVELLREETLRNIEAHMEQIVRLAGSCDLGFDDLTEMLRLQLYGTSDEAPGSAAQTTKSPQADAQRDAETAETAKAANAAKAAKAAAQGKEKNT